MSFGRAFLQGAAYSVEAGSAEEITVDGKGRYDIVERLEGSPGDDWVVLRPGETVIRGADFTNTAIGFEEVYAYGSAGKDTASLYDTAADDTFKSNGQSDWAWMRGPGYFHRAKGFDFVHGYSTGGADQAYLHDSAGDDQFKAYTDDAKDMEYAKLFDTVLARSSRGEDDLALFFDDPGTTNGQVFRGLGGKGELFGKTAGGSDFQVTARNFAAVTATESRGTGHVARLVDTPGDDHLVIDGAGQHVPVQSTRPTAPPRASAAWNFSARSWPAIGSRSTANRIRKAPWTPGTSGRSTSPCTTTTRLAGATSRP